MNFAFTPLCGRPTQYTERQLSHLEDQIEDHHEAWFTVARRLGSNTQCTRNGESKDKHLRRHIWSACCEEPLGGPRYQKDRPNRVGRARRVRRISIPVWWPWQFASVSTSRLHTTPNQEAPVTLPDFSGAFQEIPRGRTPWRKVKSFIRTLSICSKLALNSQLWRPQSG